MAQLSLLVPAAMFGLASIYLMQVRRLVVRGPQDGSETCRGAGASLTDTVTRIWGMVSLGLAGTLCMIHFVLQARRPGDH